MSDERLRALERRWREAGSAEDEAAWLQERVRTGALTQGAVELAALAGHRAARAVTGARHDDLASDEAWLRAIGARSEVAVVRIARAAAGHVVDAHAAAGRAIPAARNMADVMASVDAWLTCPCRVHEAASRDFMPLGYEPLDKAWLSNPLLFVVVGASERLAHATRVLELARRRRTELSGRDDGAVRVAAGQALAAHVLRPAREPAHPDARALARRVAEGTLAPERLRLAALLGDPHALDVLGLERPLPSWILVAVTEAGPAAEGVACRAARELVPRVRARERSDELFRAAVERVGPERALEHVGGRLRSWALDDDAG